MKQNQMGARERRAYDNILYAAYDVIGGLENTLMDFDEESDEYKNAYNVLYNHERLVESIYNCATTAYYRTGMCMWGSQVERLIRDINFLGRDVIMAMCEERVCEEGY